MTRPAREPLDQTRLLNRVRRLARLLDSSIRVPVINYRIGVDGLIGMIPGIGDVAGGLMSGYLIWQAHKAGAPGTVKAKMAGYVLLETIIGSIPVIGDLFDFGYKANLRIADALEKHVTRQSAGSSGRVRGEG